MTGGKWREFLFGGGMLLAVLFQDTPLAVMMAAFYLKADT